MSISGIATHLHFWFLVHVNGADDTERGVLLYATLTVTVKDHLHPVVDLTPFAVEAGWQRGGQGEPELVFLHVLWLLVGGRIVNVEL